MTGKKLVPLSGILAVGLTLAGFMVGGDTPDTDAPGAEIATFYTKHHSDLMAGGLLLALAGVFFLVFIATLRNFLHKSETDGAGASTLSFAGGIVFVVGLGLFAALNITLGDVADNVTPVPTESLQVLNVLSEDIFPPFAIGLMAFLIGTGAAIIKTGAMPKWLGIAIIVGALFAVSPLFPVAMLALGLFTLIASVMMSMRAGTA